MPPKTGSDPSSTCAVPPVEESAKDRNWLKTPMLALPAVDEPPKETPASPVMVALSALDVSPKLTKLVFSPVLISALPAVELPSKIPTG